MKLPVADGPAVRAAAGRLFARHRGTFVLIAVLHTLAAVAGLVGPWLLGRLVDAVTEGTTSSYVTTIVAVGAGAVVAQAVLRRYAQRLSMVFGETVFAELREDLVETVTSLPLSTVERAGTGDRGSDVTVSTRSSRSSANTVSPNTMDRRCAYRRSTACARTAPAPTATTAVT